MSLYVCVGSVYNSLRLVKTVIVPIIRNTLINVRVPLTSVRQDSGRRRVLRWDLDPTQNRITPSLLKMK